MSSNNLIINKKVFNAKDLDNDELTKLTGNIFCCKGNFC